MLLVSRIAKLPSGLGGGYVNAGSSANEQLITWERFQDKVLIKVKPYNAAAADIQIDFGTPAATSYCTAAVDADACQFVAGALTADLSAFVLGTTPATNEIRVLFRAEIQ